MIITSIERSEEELIGTIGSQDVLIVPIEVTAFTYRRNLYVPPLVSLMMAKNDEFCKLVVSSLPMTQSNPQITEYLGWSMKVYGKIVDCLFYIVKPEYDEKTLEYLCFDQFKASFSRSSDLLKRFASVFNNSVLICFYPTFGEEADKSDMCEERILSVMENGLSAVSNRIVCLRENSDDRKDPDLSTPQ